MDKNVKQIYKIILGNNGFGIHNKCSPLKIDTFPDGDVIFRYDSSSTGLPPSWEMLILPKSISKKELEKKYPLLTMFGKLK